MANILIYGAGAIGSFIGYLLSQRPLASFGEIENVAFLGREGHIKAINESGLKIGLADGEKLLKFKYCFGSLDDMKASDFYPNIVIVCVKSYSLSEVCWELSDSGMLQERLEDALFILLMNGMGNKETFETLGLPASRLIEGITSLGVKFPRGGKIELKGIGKTVMEDRIGEGTAKFLKERFSEKGFEIEFVRDFREQQWNKLFVNCVINPITALTRQQNSIILALPLQKTVQSIIEEAVGIALKEGIAASKEEILHIVYSVAEKTAGNTSSMLQDVLKERSTEIDSINGYIVHVAKKHNIKVPVNEALLALVKSAALF